jgi:hypothetical protein
MPGKIKAGEGFASSARGVGNAARIAAPKAVRATRIRGTLERWGLLAVVVFGIGLGGCSNFNTTIGTPTPAAQITTLSPGSVNVGGPPFILTVNGGTFASNSVVQWNLTNLVTTYVSGNQVTAVIPATLIAQPETVSITVDTPGAGQSNPSQGILVQDESNVLPFLVSGGGNPIPTIASLSQASIADGSKTFTIKVMGTQFVQNSVVNWNGPVSSPLCTTYVSATEVDATVWGSDGVAVTGCSLTVTNVLQTAGTVRVTVSNPAGGAGNTGGGTSNTLTFTILDPPQNNARRSGSVDGTVSSGSGPLSPAISSDHRYLAFVAPVPDPSSDASTGPTNVYVRDTCAGAAASCTPATMLISVAADGSAADGPSEAPSISADGRYVSFVSTADNLVAGGSSGNGEIFVRDTCTGAPAGCAPATALVSIAADGSFANGPSDSAYLSASGRYVVFESSATNLVPNAVSSSPAIYIRDLCTGGPAGCQASTVLLSVSGASATSP